MIWEGGKQRKTFEHPRIEGGLRLEDVLAQTGKETRPVLVVLEYI
jgi:hypothetical protein